MKLKVSISKRIKMSWLVFWCKPFRELFLVPYHEIDKVNPFECDNNGKEYDSCKNMAAVCMSRTSAKFVLDEQDHRHLCQECADKIRGQY